MKIGNRELVRSGSDLTNSQFPILHSHPKGGNERDIEPLVKCISYAIRSMIRPNGGVMKVRTVPALVVLLTSVTFGPVSHAQRSGFVVGVAPAAQPQQTAQRGPHSRIPSATAVVPPVQPFITAPVQPSGLFGTTVPMPPPIITTTYSPIY